MLNNHNNPTNIKIGDPYGQRPVIGTYIWTLRVRLMNTTETKEYKGHVNLIR